MFGDVPECPIWLYSICVFLRSGNDINKSHAHAPPSSILDYVCEIMLYYITPIHMYIQYILASVLMQERRGTSRDKANKVKHCDKTWHV